MVLCFTSTVPGASPQNLTSYSDSSTSCALTWAPVPQLYSYGTLLGYYVFYWEKNTSEVRNVTISNVSTSATVGGLKILTEYLMTIAAFNAAGTGKRSNASGCLTLEGGILRDIQLFCSSVFKMWRYMYLAFES